MQSSLFRSSRINTIEAPQSNSSHKPTPLARPLKLAGLIAGIALAQTSYAAPSMDCSNFFKQVNGAFGEEGFKASNDLYGYGIVCGMRTLDDINKSNDSSAVVEALVWQYAMSMVADTPWIGAAFEFMRSVGTSPSGRTPLSMAVERILNAIEISQEHIIDEVQSILRERDFASLKAFKAEVQAFHIDASLREQNVDRLYKLWSTSLSLRNFFEVHSSRLGIGPVIESYHTYLSIVALEVMLRAELVALEYPLDEAANVLVSHYKNELLPVMDHVDSIDWQAGYKELMKEKQGFGPTLSWQAFSHPGIEYLNTVQSYTHRFQPDFVNAKKEFEINGTGYSIRSSCRIPPLNCVGNPDGWNCTERGHTASHIVDVFCTTELAGEGDWSKFGLASVSEHHISLNKGDLGVSYDDWFGIWDNRQTLAKVRDYLSANYNMFPEDIMANVVRDTTYLDLLKTAYEPTQPLLDEWWMLAEEGGERPENGADIKIRELEAKLKTAVRTPGK